MNVNEFSPVDFTTIHSEGKRLSLIPKTKFTPLYQSNLDKFYYESYFESFDGTAIATIKDTRNVISFYKDRVIFIPKLTLPQQDEEKFLKDLINLLLKKDAAKYSFPDWVKGYYIPKELEITETIEKLNAEKLRIEAEIKESNSKVVQLQRTKALFCGSGDMLESEIKNIFNKLGFEILETKANRDDLIMKFIDKVIVSEIKGVIGTAAEKQASQLEKWVSEYHLDTGTMPKGLLIVNTFNETELNNRKDSSWPDQMFNYSTRRSHCLITGVQLLCLYLECSTHPESSEAIINDLLQTDGIVLAP